MNYKTSIIFTSLIILFSACKEKNSSEKVLSVSIEPQKYFLEKIVGDKYTVNCVIPAGTNPETFDPTPSQMVNLSKSLIYFRVGELPFENTLVKNVESNNSQIKVVNCAKGIKLIENECQHNHDDDDHHHGHDGADPHIWSSPQTAAVMAKNMFDAIVQIDPENESLYTSNYSNLLKEFAQTDSIIKSYIDTISSRSFIIFHPALSYFANEYGLHQYSVEHEGKAPSPSQLKEIIDLAKEKKIHTVFMQEEYDKKNAETIAEEIKGKIVPVNLLSYNWSDELIKIAKALSSWDE